MVTRVIADSDKLRAILSEAGLPAKLGARLNPTERKVHGVLAASYDFATGNARLDMPPALVRQLKADFAKVWHHEPPRDAGQGKVTVEFYLTPEATKTTLKTALAKDAGIFHAKVNTVRLHASWARYFKAKPKEKTQTVDWAKHEAAARRHNEAVTEQILDGKTFNAHKDNPWARKHLKNKNQ